MIVVEPYFNYVDNWWKTDYITLPISGNIILTSRPNPRDCPAGYPNGAEAAFAEGTRIVVPIEYQSAAWKSTSNFSLFFICKQSA